jgi:two-component system NtrC family sensor kinase
MKKIIFNLSILLINSQFVFGQKVLIDSLNKNLQITTIQDTARVNQLNKLATILGNTDKKKSDSLFRLSLDLASRLKYNEGQVNTYISLAFFNREKERFDSAKQMLFQALQLSQQKNNLTFAVDAVNNFYHDYYADFSGNYIGQLEFSLYYLKLAEQFNKPILVADACTNVASVYSLLGSESKALEYHIRSLTILNKTGNNSMIRVNAVFNLAHTYRAAEKFDLARQYLNKALQLAILFPSFPYVTECNASLAFINEKQKHYSETFNYAFKALPNYLEIKDNGGTSWISSILAKAYLNTNKIDSAFYFAIRSLHASEKINNRTAFKNAHEVLSDIYRKRNDFESAYFHHLLYENYKDSLFNKTSAQQASFIEYNAELSQKQNKISLLESDKTIREQEAKRQKLLFYGLVLGITLILILMIVLVRSYRIKQRANNLLQQQKEKVESTLSELRSTQTQLIQSEKMASLGQLTAGIAHEIQNPLNFVNNFSEVNTELIDELKTELATGNTQQAIELANDIKDNEQKINHHGKRADAIVKGMLQHSQSSKGHKAPTDINALCDEYLRLSYHGLRAKDKSFNATIKTDFDNAIGNINIIPQDIGRVLLNLFNNAFYAVNEKNLTVNQEGFKNLPGLNYEPTVSISTKKLNDKVEIKVSDNGNGIAQNIVDKIFQPFFTTKPTGQGTGLGLSLSYDIIKAHGGEMKVESKEGEATTFIIKLPV